MRYDLYGRGGRAFHFMVWDWPRLLTLAQEYGWDPVGTRPPQRWQAEGMDRPWNGNYTTNDHQWVTRSDATALADSLERALPDLPDHAAQPGRPAVEALARKLGSHVVVIDAGVGSNLMERFSGDQKKRLKAFVRFCREGGFAIG